MPLLTVTSGPTAPSGRTIETTSRLTIVYREAYSDGIEVYADRYEGQWDTVNQRWKPVGAADGQVLKVPGGGDGYPLPPTCHLVEELVLDDGTEVTTRRGPLRIRATSVGEWVYATP